MQDFDAILFGELGEDFLAEVFVFLGPTYVAKFFKAGTFFFATSQASAKVVKGVSQICLLCPKFIRSSSEVHPKFIRSSSEVHPKFIRSSSEVHEAMGAQHCQVFCLLGASWTSRMHQQMGEDDTLGRNDLP